LKKSAVGKLVKVIQLSTKDASLKALCEEVTQKLMLSCEQENAEVKAKKGRVLRTAPGPFSSILFIWPTVKKASPPLDWNTPAYGRWTMQMCSVDNCRNKQVFYHIFNLL
jgi:hypothetical protein